MKTIEILKELDLTKLHKEVLLVFPSFLGITKNNNIYIFEGVQENDNLEIIIENHTINQESTEEKLQKNKAFGNQLLDTFLVDNMNMQIAFTTELSVAMMQRFSPIEFLARNGDIKNVRLLIMNSTIDAVFTQERKDKYVLMCSNYLAL